MSEKFCLKWNDFQSNVSNSFSLLRNEAYLQDVTIVTDDNEQMAAHKLVLSACSEYFRNIFMKNKHSHPLLCLEGLSSKDVRDVMDYMYQGEVKIFQEDLDRFLAVAQRLKLEGLLNGNENDLAEEVNNKDTENFKVEEKQYLPRDSPTRQRVNPKPTNTWSQDRAVAKVSRKPRIQGPTSF